MVYLIHFDKPYKHAQHYIGFTNNLDARVDRHKKKNGSKLLKAVENAGIGFKVVKTWEGGQKFRTAIKKQKNASRFCPICRQKRKG